MKNPMRNIAALVSGIVIGSIVNYTLIIAGGFMIEPPAGVDMSDAQSIAAGMEYFTPVHFLFPFLGHALGTLVGALVTCSMASDHKVLFTLFIGVIFLAGGIAATIMIPAPMWFVLCDLLIAYLPMAWLAFRLRRPNLVS